MRRIDWASAHARADAQYVLSCICEGDGGNLVAHAGIVYLANPETTAATEISENIARM